MSEVATAEGGNPGGRLWRVMPSTGTRPTLADLPRYLTYLYALGFGLAIYLLQPNLIVGPSSVDIRFSLVVPLAMVAFGQTLALFSRGIDLSVGGVVSLTTALVATHLTGSGGLLAIQLVGVLAVGVGLGMVNGVLIAITNLQPFIVTLATWLIWGGVAFAVLPVPGGKPGPDLTQSVTGDIGGLPKSVLVVVVLLLAWLWLRRTALVRDLFAIGSDESRARLIGVPLARRKIQVYALSGLLAAAAGIWVTAQNVTGSPTAGNPFILNSVAAVVIGGTSIFGGRGSIASSIVGTLVFLMIPDLVFALHLESFWSIFFQGAILIAAVTVNSVVQARSK